MLNLKVVADLLGLPGNASWTGVQVNKVEFDSRQVEPGDLFVAAPHQAAAQAVGFAGEDEFLHRPARGDGDARPPAGEVVEDRPVLGHPHRARKPCSSAKRALSSNRR